MRRFPGPGILTIALTAALLAVPAALAGDRGSGKLVFDRPAITALVRAGMPEAVKLPVPGLGEATLRLRAPHAVEFREGGVETTIAFTLADLRLSGALRLRYVPETDPETGGVRLVAESAVPMAPVKLPIDLAPFLPSADIPPSMEWQLAGPADNPGTLTLFVREIRVDPQHLVISFDLVSNR